MNTRISREFEFHASIHHEDSFFVNSYSLGLHMEVTTESIHEQNIALDRIKFLLEMCFDSCVFVDQKEVKAIEAYAKAGMTVCPLPNEPYDQIIGAVMLSKFNAVTERNLYVTEVQIQSRLCDDVCFYIGDDEEADFQHLNNVWWNDNSPNISTNIKHAKREKVVQLRKEPIDWNMLGLGWKEDQPKSTCDKGEIVFIPTGK